MIITVVGAGGKTTLIHQLAQQYRKEGKRVFVTTTTHMFQEADTLLTDDAEQILAQLNRTGYVMAGLPANDGKIRGLSPETFAAVAAEADETLVEGDGSRQLPLKYPAETEPVIPPGTGRIIVVMGLHGLGQRVSDVCFRPELVKQCLHIEDDTIIIPAHIQELIRKGYKEHLMKEYPNTEIQIYTSNPTSLYARAVSALLNAEMDPGMIKPEWFAEKPCLFICGGGHVSRALAEIAVHLDLRIHVIDPRPELANPENYPMAEKVICDGFENLNTHLVPGAYYTVVTPGHQDDYTCVCTILNSPYTYLGMIGSHRKVAHTFEKLRAEDFTEEQIQNIHAPIGLPIKANTPSEIAVSILAEIIQEKNQNPTASALSELVHTNRHGVLCIIIDKTGSAPRGVGSMMLVTEDGQLDTIGGGTLEHAAVQDARETRTPTIREYNLNNEDSSRLGMICGGTNKILFIPV